MFILVCDGGGIRGRATVSFLYHMEQHMKKINPEFSIHDQFDMFAGSSIGALISMLFVHKKKTAKEIYDILNNDTCQSIMDKSLWDKAVGIIQHKPKYDGIEKQYVINKYLGNIKYNETNNKYLLVPVYNITKRKTKVFYSNTCNSELLAKDVANAASAAPGYFPCVEIPNCDDNNGKCNTDWFIDGGIVSNNSTISAISQAFEITKDTDCKLVVINIGTGYKTHTINGNDALQYGGIEWLLNDILGIAMDETLVIDQATLLLKNHHYINVNSELIDVSDSLDDSSDDNLNKLDDLGKLWWETYCKQIVPLFDLKH